MKPIILLSMIIVMGCTNSVAPQECSLVQKVKHYCFIPLPTNNKVKQCGFENYSNCHEHSKFGAGEGYVWGDCEVQYDWVEECK